MNFATQTWGFSKFSKIEDEIEKTDNQIEKMVYRIYGLTEAEIEIIEKSFEKDYSYD
jgi:Zn-dependent membrane protease YugP